MALPSEISVGDRSQITRQFAEELVSRYGVAVDAAISEDRDQATKPGGRNYARKRLKEIMQKDTGGEDSKPSANERLKEVLSKPCEKLEIEDARDQEKDQEVERDRELDRDADRDSGFNH